MQLLRSHKAHIVLVNRYTRCNLLLTKQHWGLYPNCYIRTIILDTFMCVVSFSHFFFFFWCCCYVVSLLHLRMYTFELQQFRFNPINSQICNQKAQTHSHFYLYMQFSFNSILYYVVHDIILYIFFVCSNHTFYIDGMLSIWFHIFADLAECSWTTIIFFEFIFPSKYIHLRFSRCLALNDSQ